MAGHKRTRRDPEPRRFLTRVPRKSKRLQMMIKNQIGWPRHNKMSTLSFRLELSDFGSQKVILVSAACGAGVCDHRYNHMKLEYTDPLDMLYRERIISLSVHMSLYRSS
eukprot:g46112.t1